MIAIEAWQAFGGVLAVVIALGSGAFALQRLGILRPRVPAPAPTKIDPDFLMRLSAVEKEVSELRLHIAHRYVSREDWIPFASRITGMLEEHTRSLARLEERTRE